MARYASKRIQWPSTGDKTGIVREGFRDGGSGLANRPSKRQNVSSQARGNRLTLQAGCKQDNVRFSSRERSEHRLKAECFFQELWSGLA